MLYTTKEFEWDDEKSHVNFKKHGITFMVAAEIWHDPEGLDTPDLLHSYDEERWLRIGRRQNGQTIVVIYCERGEKIRLISARPADEREEELYYERSLRLL